jgi:hypothetical protein
MPVRFDFNEPTVLRQDFDLLDRVCFISKGAGAKVQARQFDQLARRAG